MRFVFENGAFRNRNEEKAENDDNEIIYDATYIETISYHYMYVYILWYISGKKFLAL